MKIFILFANLKMLAIFIMSSDPTAVTSLPVPLPSDGTFDVNVNITSTEFSDPSGDNSTYSRYIIDPARLIGTDDAPYQPVANGAYIATLYQNCYYINNNLQNDISAAAIDNRQYPTSYAVQKYVQSQIAGTQIINATNQDIIVETTVNNTVVETVNTNAVAYTYPYVDPSGNTISADVAVYTMDNAQNDPRNGASKVVVFADPNFGGANTLQTGDVVYLYAGDNANFVYNGQELKYYQFTYLGDNLSFVMLYNSSTSTWQWLVTNCNSVFSSAITVGPLTPA
jgi:hypothetical protein